MDISTCITKVMEAGAGRLTKDDAKKLLAKFRELNESSKTLPVGEQFARNATLLNKAAEGQLGALEITALEAKHNQLQHEILLIKAEEQISSLLNTPKKKDGKPVLGKGGKPVMEYTLEKAIDAWMHGSPKYKNSVAAQWQGATLMFKNVLQARLEEGKLKQYWQNKETVAEAVKKHFNPEAEVSPEGEALAGVLSMVNKLAYVRLNQVGQYAPDTKRLLFNYRSADPDVVRGFSKVEFVTFLAKEIALDPNHPIAKMKLPARLRKFGKIYDTLTGQAAERIKGFDGLKGPAKEDYKKAGAMGLVEGTIPFADGDSWLKYTAKFGSVAPQIAILRQLDGVGRTVGLRQSMGPVPEYFLKSLLNKFSDKMTPEEYSFLMGQEKGKRPDPTKKIEEVPKAVGGTLLGAGKKVSDFFHRPNPYHSLAYMDGTVNSVVDGVGARISSGIRAVTAMSTLSQGIFTQIPDVVIKMARIQKLSRDNFMASAFEQVGELLDIVPAESKQSYLRHLGIGLDILRHELTYDLVGGAGAQDGLMAKALDLSYKLNGMSYIDQKYKSHSASWLSTQIADLVKDRKSVPGLYDELSRYGWEEQDYVDLGLFLSDIEGMDARLVDLKTLQGKAPDLYQKYVGTVNSLINDLTPTPGVRERSITQKGMAQGSAYRILLDMMFMFKSYPIMMVTRVLPQLRADHGIAGTLFTLSSLMAAYYASDSVKQMVNNKTRKPLSDPKNFMDLVVRSGFGGLYADSIIKDYSSYGTSWMGAAAGPVGGKLDQVLDMTTGTVADVVSGEFKPEPSQLLKFGGRATEALLLSLMPKVADGVVGKVAPFSGIVHPILDRLLLYAIMEAEDPGSVDRSYQELQERTGQGRLF